MEILKIFLALLDPEALLKVLWMSQIQLLTSKISHICQEIRDIKRRKKPQSNLANRNYINAGLDEGLTSQSYTLEQDGSSSAKEGSDDGDGWDETYSSRSKLHPPEPNNPYIPSHHAPVPPSPNPALYESMQELPGDLSPSPASKIVTLTPSSPAKLEKKACSAALSSLVHTSPSGPCTAWNILPLTRNRLGEELEEESGMTEDSSSVTGERGGGPGVGGLRPMQGGGTGMAIDRLGGAKEDRTQSGTGCPSPQQVQQMES